MTPVAYGLFVVVVNFVSDMDIAFWDRAQDVWTGFSLEFQYGVDGMTAGGQPGSGLVHKIHALF